MQPHKTRVGVSCTIVAEFVSAWHYLARLYEVLIFSKKSPMYSVIL